MSAPAIGVRQRWAPAPSAVIDWSHPLAQGLRHCIRPLGAKVVDLVTGRELTVDSTAATGATQFGRGVRSSGAATGAYLPLSSPPPYPLTMTWVGDADCATAVGGSGLLMYSYGSGGGWGTDTAPFAVGIDYGTGVISVNRASNATYVGGLSLSTSRVTGVATVTIQSGSAILYVNGNRVGTDNDALTDMTAANFSGLGFQRHSNTSGRTQAATGSLGLVHGRFLSDAEVASLAADPFQIFRQ